MWLAWVLLGYLLGSLPFSVYLGRLARGVDIRVYGDANPGSSNVLRAAGWGWGLAAMLLDGLKGAIPVGLAWFWGGLHGWQMVAVALAPGLGHATSPWLGWRGGKAVAVSFGIWAGLTLGAGPTVFGLLLAAMFAMLASSAWALLAAFLLFGVFVWQTYAPLHPEFLWIWCANLLLLIWKHRAELLHRPELRRWKPKKDVYSGPARD